MSDKPFNVLFLCTGNSARSILAESALRKNGGDRFRAFSAGSFPKGVVHPETIRLLKGLDYPTEGLRSKSWDEFSGPDAPKMDFIFTVCDDAAGESCPVWAGHPMTAHWGIEDPSRVEGSEIERVQAFATALRYLENRISLLLALPIDKLQASTLHAKINEIGKAEGASSPRVSAA
ncbi:arsenate reductase ArsC [Sandaracinobacter sp. RS1-74]|uniref:arsenate reductase ArsC n=1 Tax=Sandaracinobacteroides sayramensis TaxID=2913411 RepID=UPI001EDA06A4|nr:arsenate reductase ArsC [Sandaracinobacteroides sayramensis]MCG2839941.1 arsenate reductase ArsC [Sandaracinobacteroides sayramensis]